MCILNLWYILQLKEYLVNLNPCLNSFSAFIKLTCLIQSFKNIAGDAMNFNGAEVGEWGMFPFNHVLSIDFFLLAHMHSNVYSLKIKLCSIVLPSWVITTVSPLSFSLHWQLLRKDSMFTTSTCSLPFLLSNIRSLPWFPMFKCIASTINSRMTLCSTWPATLLLAVMTPYFWFIDSLIHSFHKYISITHPIVLAIILGTEDTKWII